MPAEETPAFGGIAERFRRAGDLDRAIALCRDGLKRFPNQLSARVTLGWALLDKGQYDGARAELEQVLRRAPDNLAAIRGLAELHDRAEAAMSEAAQESWRSEQAGTSTQIAAGDAVAADVEAAEAAVQTDSDQFAPIPGAFDAAAASHQPSDVVHTADHAEFALDAADPISFEEPVDLIVTPVELEDPAAISMAAAEPAPFFVVDPSEDIVDAKEAPETLADAVMAAAVERADDPVESPILAQMDAADLAAADDSSVALESSPAAFLTDEIEDGAFEAVATFDASDPAAELTGNDWAALATLADGIEDPVDVQVSIDASTDWAVVETAAGQTISDTTDTDLTLAEASALPEGMLTSTADWVTEALGQATSSPEALEDIDETAGLELADAIKALEQAARRVEAKLAPPAWTNEPSASPDAIAAFEFIDASGQPLFGPRDTDTPDSGASIIDTSKDGAFELVSPDLTNLDLAPTLGADEAAQPSDGDVETAPDTSFTPVLAFDDDADDAYGLASGVEASLADGVAAVVDDVEAATPVVEVDDLDLLRAFGDDSDTLGERVVDIAGLAFIEAADAAFSSDGIPDAFVEPSDGGQPDAAIEVLDELKTAEAELEAAEETQDDDLAAESVGLSTLGEIDVVEVSADGVIDTAVSGDSEPLAETSIGEDDSTFGLGENDVVQQADDTTGEDEAIPAAAFSAVDPADAPVVPPAFVAAGDVVEEIAAIEDGATAIAIDGTEVGDDETEVVAGELVHVQPAVALVATSLDAPVVPVMTPKARLQVRALERFLRQVQVRQLELHSETVA